MRKLAYLGFVCVLAMGIGCAFTDYETITDNAQFANDTGKAAANLEPGFVVDTNGFAKIKETSQVALIWDDGTDNLITFVDQKANADRKLNTYNNFATGGQATFSDDLFCNADFGGCAVWLAKDSGTCDPLGGGCFANFQFDGRYNENCFGNRSLSTLAATSRYLGECGNNLFGDDSDGDMQVPLADIVQLWNMGREGQYGGIAGMYFDVDHTNTNILVNGVNLTVNDHSIFMSPRMRYGVVDLRHPLNAQTADQFTQSTNVGEQFDVQVIYNGISSLRTGKLVSRGYESHFGS